MKAIALISGGLDSILAAKLIEEQGIEIVPLNFRIPFCHLNKDGYYDTEDRVQLAASNLDAEAKIIDISDEFLRMLKNPDHGYGSNMNPCIDCKIIMLRKAKEFMEQFDAKFIITGEVLGQRPMSQHKQTLSTIAKKADLEGLVLRPLSAKLLLETIPEKEGWIKREKLLSFNGRGRKFQIELAKTFDIKEYAQPAGGCLLTDPQFAKRIKDLLKHGELNLNNVELLKIGRHFRLSPNAKLVVGRNERENKQLVNLSKENDYLFLPPSELAGPTSLGRGSFSEELIKLSCSITCRYCDLNGSISADIVYKRLPEKEDKVLNITALKDDQLLSLRI